MNSKLNAMCLADNHPELPDWMHTLADIVGAPRVYYRFRNSRKDGEILWVDNQKDFDWIKSHHLRDLAKYFGVTEVKLYGGLKNE